MQCLVVLLPREDLVFVAVAVRCGEQQESVVGRPVRPGLDKVRDVDIILPFATDGKLPARRWVKIATRCPPTAEKTGTGVVNPGHGVFTPVTADSVH